MKILLIIAGVMVGVYILLWVTREAWSEPLSSALALKVHDAVHDPSPSQPSFIKDFGIKTAKKFLQLEVRSF